MKIAARIVGLTLLIATTWQALERWTWLPLRCAHAASFGLLYLDGAPQPLGDEQTRRVSRRVRLRLEGCDFVSPPDAGIPTVLGAAAESLGDERGAVEEYQRALLIDRRPEIYLALGIAQLAELDHHSGVENIARACAFDPVRLSEVPYPEIREEAKQQIEARYGAEWLK